MKLLCLFLFSWLLLQSGTGITYGVLIGSQVDDINIKVQQIRQLYSYSPDDNLQQFTEQAVARIYELLQDPTNSGEFIGWYQANVGLSCAIPNIVTETFKSIQESFMGDTACKSTLFMVIDIQKSKHDISFPCMECYDLRKACKPDTNPVGSALAFSFNWTMLTVQVRLPLKCGCNIIMVINVTFHFSLALSVTKEWMCWEAPPAVDYRKETCRTGCVCPMEKRGKS